MVTKEFAEYLNDLLCTEDRSASWLARRIGVAPSTVSRWLDGSTQPDSIMRVEMILNALRIKESSVRDPVLQAYRYWWNYRAGAPKVVPA